jgi:hypothetical protein
MEVYNQIYPNNFLPKDLIDIVEEYRSYPANHVHLLIEYMQLIADTDCELMQLSELSRRNHRVYYTTYVLSFLKYLNYQKRYILLYKSIDIKLL